MVSAKSLWGTVLFGGNLQIDAKNLNFEIFGSTLYMKSESMPLRSSQSNKWNGYWDQAQVRKQTNLTFSKGASYLAIHYLNRPVLQ